MYELLKTDNIEQLTEGVAILKHVYSMCKKRKDTHSVVLLQTNETYLEEQGLYKRVSKSYKYSPDYTSEQVFTKFVKQELWQLLQPRPILSRRKVYGCVGELEKQLIIENAIKSYEVTSSAPTVHLGTAGKFIEVQNKADQIINNLSPPIEDRKAYLFYKDICENITKGIAAITDRLLEFYKEVRLHDYIRLKTPPVSYNKKDIYNYKLLIKAMYEYSPLLLRKVTIDKNTFNILRKNKLENYVDTSFKKSISTSKYEESYNY